MKLARIALTPPIIAISVFAFFALTLSAGAAEYDLDAGNVTITVASGSTESATFVGSDKTRTITVNGGGTVYFTDQTFTCATIAVSGDGTKLYVDGGSITTTTSFKGGAVNASGKVTEIHILSGTHNFKDFQACTATAIGRIFCEGGTITTTGRAKGCTSNKPAEGDFIVDGATVTPSEIKPTFIGNNGTGRVILRSGVLSMKNNTCIFGWGGVDWVIGDGGTIRADAANRTFIDAATGLEYAVLTGSGLIVDTGTYSGCKMPHPLANYVDPDSGEESEGILYKKGTSQLLINGDGSTHAKTVVQEGSVVFDAAVTAHPVVEAIGGTLSYKGTTGSPALKGLVLGTAETAGTLEVDNTDVIALSEANSFAAGKGLVNLTDVSTPGTYGLVTMPGEASDAVKAAWGGCTVGNADVAKVYTFGSSYDSGADLTTLTITVGTKGQTSWASPVDGNWTDGTKWTAGVQPGDEDVATFGDDGTYTVSFPTAVATATALAVTKDSGKTTFNVGASWTIPSATTYPAEYPLYFASASGKNLFVQQNGANGILRAENAVFSVEGGSTLHTIFSSGTVDFAAPDGTQPATLNKMTIGAAGDTVTEFAGGAVTLPALDILPKSATTEFIVTGGRHAVKGAAKLAPAANACKQVDFEVSNGGDFAFEGGLDMNSVGDRTVNMSVTGAGSRFAVGGSSWQTRATHHNITVTDGGTFEINAPTTFSNLGGNNTLLTVDGGTFTANAAVNFGVNNDTRWCEIAATDGTFNFNAATALKRGKYVFTDCTINATAAVGLYHPSEMLLSGGSFTSTSTLSAGNDSGTSTNVITISGGTHRFQKLIGSANSRGVIVIDDGAVVSVTDAGDTAVQACSGSGYGCIVVNDGELNVPYGIRMSGIFTSAASICKTVLNGGVTSCKIVHGWSGTDYLVGNGGVLKASAAGTDLVVSTVEHPQCGAKGLILSTDFETTVASANFENLDDEEGELVKRGTGVLTLKGPNSTHSYTVAEEGRIVFDAVVVNHPSLKARKGGVLSFLGSRSIPSVPTLTLGDGETEGVLELDNDDVVVLTAEDGFVPTKAKVILSNPATDGTYGIVKVPGEASAANIEAWANTVADLPEGKDYTYTAETAGGFTTYYVTIGDKKQASGTAHWTGTSDADWGNAGNWTDDAQVPSKETTAFFDSDSAPKNVNVGSGAVAAGLHLSGYPGYMLGGDGALTLSDGVAGAIEVAAADHEISVPVAVKSTMPVTVAEGASLALNGPVTQDGLVKRGAGSLTLGAANDLRYGLRVEEGTLTATAAGAFANKPLALNGEATFRYTGSADAVTSEPLQIDTGAAAAKATVVADGNVAFAGIVNTSGSIVKEGVGTLTLTAGEKQTLAHSGETVTVTDGALDIDIPSGVTLANGATINVRDRMALTGAGTLDGGNISVYPDRETDEPQEATLTIADATAKLNGIYLIPSGYQRTDATATVKMNRANVSIGQDLHVNSMPGKAVSVLEAKDSTLTVQTYYLDGEIDFTFDNTQLTPKRVIFNAPMHGTMRFLNGSSYNWGGSYENNSAPTVGSTYGCHYIYDGGSIVCKSGGWALVGLNQQIVETTGAGMAFDITDAAGAFDATHPIVGDGGLVKRGPGRLEFKRVIDGGHGYGGNKKYAFTNVADVVALAYDGPTTVLGGTLAISNGLARSDAKVSFASGTSLDLFSSEVALGSVAGSPTVVNGTLAADLVVSNGDQMVFGDAAQVKAAAFRLTYAYSAADLAAGTEILPRVDFGANPPSGVRVIVDLGNGETADDPLVVEAGESVSGVIATYTGSDPDVSLWRVKGLGGVGVRGVVTAANGEIRLTLMPGSGLRILVR